MAGAYSNKTLHNYVHGLRAWHILYGIPWTIDENEVRTMLNAAEKLAPPNSKRKKRRPYTPDFILAVKNHLDMSCPLDAAVYACLTTCFYAAARLGEFTVPRLNGFDPAKHVTPMGLSQSVDRLGNEMTVLRLPRSKANNQGEDVHWAKQEGGTDPVAALEHHRHLNAPPENGHLFAYKFRDGHRPLTKPKFIQRVAAAARSAGLEPLQGHGIRIGATLEYLLRGVPFDVMKAKGRWASDAFQLYLTKHAQILAPYMQAVPNVQAAFTRYIVPPVR